VVVVVVVVLVLGVLVVVLLLLLLLTMMMVVVAVASVVVLLLVPIVLGTFGQLALTWLLATPGGTPRRALGIALRTLPGYLLAALLITVPISFLAMLIITPATSLGLVLLIAPCLYLSARMFLIGPAMVIEALGPVAALRRSWIITAPVGWTILLLLVISLVFAAAAVVLASGVGAAFGLVLGWSIILDVLTKDWYDEERFPRENIYDDIQ
jgi:hypothetical protein